MRETNFIKQNKAKWKRFESMLKFKQRNPQELSKLFIQITDDLSYSRTFYKNRSVRVYLNNLAQQIFYNIYKSKKNKRGSLFAFWTDELPQLIYESRKALLLSFLLFVLAFGIGMVSCYIDNDFPRVILGDGYVDMTIRNIERGDPMAVYKQRNEIDMTFFITFNNLMVGFRTFLTGLLTSIGTMGMLLYNGIMIGAFQFFFYEQGVLRESLLTVWIHGTIEISTIILAGCAGITLGNGLIFPGTYSRMQSLQKSALRGLKIMFGTVPLIILAGLIESFVTRYTDAPDVLRLGIILSSLSFVLLYFVWYPWQKFRYGAENPIKDTKIPPSRNQKINYRTVKTSAEIFIESFQFYRQNFGKIFRVAFLLAVTYMIIVFYNFDLDISEQIYFSRETRAETQLGILLEQIFVHPLRNLGQFFDYKRLPLLVFVNTVIFGIAIYWTSLLFLRQSDKERRYKWYLHAIGLLGSIGVWGIFNTIVWNFDNGFMRLIFVVFALLLIWLIVILKEGKNPFSGLIRTWSLIRGRFGRIYSVVGTMILVSLLICLVLNSMLFWQVVEIIDWNVDLGEAESNAVLACILTFLFALIFCLAFPLFIISMGLTYVSLKEIRDADDLSEKIKNIGIRSRKYGLEVEKS